MRRAGAVLALVTLACSGIATPEPEPAAVTPAVDEPAPLAFSAERLPEDLRAKLAEVEQEIRGITDPASFAAAWRNANALTIPLGEAFQAQLGEGVCLDWGAEAVKLPSMQLGCVAEGTQADVSLPVAPWQAAARKTPGNADDQVIGLFERVYAAASPEPFATWMVQTWDYGGCSALGTGVILRILLEADSASAAGDLFAPEIAVVRAGALGEIVDVEGHSQYCTGSSPMPDEALQNEARDVLVQVKLTPEEKQAVEARIPALRGERFTGG